VFKLYALTVGLGERSYPIYITRDYSDIGKILKNLGIDGKIIIITDNNVDIAQAPAFTEALESAGFMA